MLSRLIGWWTGIIYKSKGNYKSQFTQPLWIFDLPLDPRSLTLYLILFGIWLDEIRWERFLHTVYIRMCIFESWSFIVTRISRHPALKSHYRNSQLDCDKRKCVGLLVRNNSTIPTSKWKFIQSGLSLLVVLNIYILYWYISAFRIGGDTGRE